MSIHSPHDIYVRHTDKDGGACLLQHRVWDAEKFMAARKAEALKAGGKAAAQQLTEAQFLAAKK